MKTLIALLVVLPPWLAAAQVGSDKSDESSPLAAELEKAKKDVTETNYLLRYRFAPGEEVRTKVVHLGTTETKIQGNTQTSQSRSVSTKLWRINGVDQEGNVSLVHSIEKIDMWQHVTGRPEVRYDSTSGEDPPPEYEMAAKTVGVPLTEATISPTGEIISRESKLKQMHLGMGELALPLPQQRVKVGDQWSTPAEVRVRLPDGIVKVVKTRQAYTLEKILTGVATIRLKTEVLTPVNDPRVKAQLVQQLNGGTIKFDVDNGRVLSRQMDWDETVIGFNGADSIMQYLARYTEELVSDEPAKVAADDAAEQADQTRR